MKIQEIFETTGTSRFSTYEEWATDIAKRYPNIERFSSENEEEILAYDKKSNTCVGRWNKTKNLGAAYRTPRPISMFNHNARRIKQV